MRSSAFRYPVDRYLVESSKNFEMVNIIEDDIWNSEPALRPEDEIILRKLHEMLQSTADDLKLLSGELSKFHEPGVQVKSVPTPLDDDFNEKVHIEEVVNAKFHGYKMIEKPLHIPNIKPRNDTIDGIKANETKIVNTDVKVKAAPVIKRPVKNNNLGISRTRIIEINSKNQDSNKSEKLNNGKVLNNTPAVAYNEFSYKYVEPKGANTPRVLEIQDMPSINIRSELIQQNVLQLDILPESKEVNEKNTARRNVSVVSCTHDTVQKQSTIMSSKAAAHRPATSSCKQPIRKFSKMSTCESSESTNNADSDAKAKLNAQNRIVSAIKNSPKTSARDRIRNIAKRENDKRLRSNVDEWKKKLNAVYGPVCVGKTKLPIKKKTAKSSSRLNLLNNAEYLPYSQLTLGGVRVSDIEREISNLPNNTDIPLSPILDKILSSKENSFYTESPRKRPLKNSPKILTTSDENLLQEVIDIERSVSETLSMNLLKKINEPVVKSQNVSSESQNDGKENESYADDFEDDKSDHSDKSGNNVTSSENEFEEKSNKSIHDKNTAVSSANDVSIKMSKAGSSNGKHTTSIRKPNLSIKESVDIFEFLHSIDTQEIATQSNESNKITPQETQTSPPNERLNIHPIHNDLWPSIDPRQEVEKMFELEKDFIKRLIIDEYGDLLEKNINKPSTSSEPKEDDCRKNIAASQKNTQTSPAHVKSVMTSPRKTKTRTTSPFNLLVPVHQQTSPVILLPNEEDEKVTIEIEADDISVNLSSPRFRLRLPQNSQEVLSKLGDQSRSQSRLNVRYKPLNNKTFTKTPISSSSSLDVDNSSSDVSSIGEIKIKRRLRRREPSVSEYSSSSTISKYSIELQSAGILPLRSEGEASLQQVSRKRLQKSIKSDGETSFPLP